MGEFLGRADGLGLATMHAYVDQEDFAGRSIDDALRQLLGGFRLPGEIRNVAAPGACRHLQRSMTAARWGSCLTCGVSPVARRVDGFRRQGAA